VWYEIPDYGASQDDRFPNFGKRDFPVFYTVPDQETILGTKPGEELLETIFVPGFYLNPLMWHHYPLYRRPPKTDPWDDLRRHLMTNHWFSKTYESSSPPERGVYFSVSATEWNAPSPVAFLSNATLTILPYFSEEAGLLMRYDLFIDQDIKKTYRYKIKKCGMGGLLLLPFAWVNLITDDLDDAIVATANQFFLDAERDGYFKSVGSDLTHLFATGGHDESLLQEFRNED
jgi:hypothetical protein